MPDETTVCTFRHLLEEHNLGEEILGTVNLHLQAKGVRITTGTIVRASPGGTQQSKWFLMSDSRPKTCFSLSNEMLS